MKSRLCCHLVVLFAVAAWAAPGWGQSGAGGLELLPQATSPAATLPAELNDVVIHAAGGVVLSVPAGWHVAEVPWIREERLVITPVVLSRRDRMPDDGCWLSYHCRPREGGDPRAELAEIVTPRLQLATDSQAEIEGPVVWEQIGGWPACRQAFAIAGDAQSRPPREAERGEHLAVRTPWGIVEIHAVYPAALAAEREATLRGMLAGMQLAAPQRPAGEIAPSVAAAAEALGPWKAYASRVELRGDGRIFMSFDARRRVTLERQNGTPAHIAGHFRAEGDVIYVTWDDGSQQNFRWRRAEQDLLLTDHDGQVSTLRRLFQ